MNPLKTATGTVIVGFAIAILIALLNTQPVLNQWSIVLWAHVIVGITWIGLLYYFNLVQVQALAEAAADEGGPGGGGITKYVAPKALLFFRWAALFTWLTGAFYLMVNSDLISAFRRAKDLVGQLRDVYSDMPEFAERLGRLSRAVSRDEVMVIG